MGRPSTMPRLLAALEAGRGTQRELQERSGLSIGSVSRHLTALLAETPRRIRIVRWRRHPHGGPFEAVYALRRPHGRCTDAPMPTRLTEAEKSARYRERARRSGDWDDVMARRRADYWTRRRKPRRDAMITALFGAPA
jgi:DNA-binding Lrp family transcriptional regulator